MSGKKFDFYTDPVQMEPLVIDESRPAYHPLIGLAHELSEASATLEAKLTLSTASALSELVIGMNCYYSNLIEGHHTLPIDIDRVLRERQDAPKQRDLQSLALAHIEADRQSRAVKLDKKTILPFMLDTHRAFCERLPEDQLRLKDGSIMKAGEFRGQDVSVGIHVPPRHDTLPRFLERAASVYGQRIEWAEKGGISKLDAILACFAAHHRIAWVHPFPDGNGRVARITLDTMLRSCGVNGTALWSMSRGFAKTSEQYKAALANADAPRKGALDGRGNLSEDHLAAFITYGIKKAIDQATFMAHMFSLETIEERVKGYIHRVRFDLKPESAHLILHAFTMGEFDRGEAARITGMPERTARDVLGRLRDEGFLQSDSIKGKVRIGFPMHALGSLFPNLYPAGDMDFGLGQLPAKSSRSSKRA